MPSRIAGSLQVAEDIAFQRRQWVAERIGWFLMLAVVILALAGVTGTGLASGTTAQSGSAELEYERFARQGASSELSLSIPTAAITDGSVAVTIDGGYLDGVEIESIVPEPQEQVAVEAGLELVFGASGEADAVRVAIVVLHQDIGIRSGWVRVADGPSIDYWQGVYP